MITERWTEGLARAHRAPDAHGEGPLLPISSRPQGVLALGEVASRAASASFQGAEPG